MRAAHTNCPEARIRSAGPLAAIMMTSALLANGTEHITTVLDDLVSWFVERGYDSTDQARGSLSQGSIPNPDAFERSNYAHTLASYRRPI